MQDWRQRRRERKTHLLETYTSLNWWQGNLALICLIGFLRRIDHIRQPLK